LKDFIECYDKLLEELDEAERLREEIANLKSENERLRKENQDLKSQVMSLKSEVQSLREQLGRTVYELTRYTNMLGPESSSTYRFIVSRFPRKVVSVYVRGHELAHRMLNRLAILSQDRPIPEDVLRQILATLKTAGIVTEYRIVYES